MLGKIPLSSLDEISELSLALPPPSLYFLVLDLVDSNHQNSSGESCAPKEFLSRA